MSSDESLVEDSDNSNSDSNSEEDEDKSSTAKKLPLRSVEFEQVIASLDQKLDHRRSVCSKAMCLKVQDGRDSTCPKPDDLPEWASNLFNWTQLSICIVMFSYWYIINPILLTAFMLWCTLNQMQII